MNTDSCVVNLNNLVPFEWDTMYIFSSSSDNAFISNTMKLEYRGIRIPSNFRRLIFTYGKHLVHDESFCPHSINRSTIDFQFINDSILKVRGYSVYVNDAIFRVSKEKMEASCTNCFIYCLNSINKK